MVLVLEVMVWELVAPKVMEEVDAVSVIPVESFKLPKMVALPVSPHVPAKPVKSTFLTV